MIVCEVRERTTIPAQNRFKGRPEACVPTHL